MRDAKITVKVPYKIKRRLDSLAQKTHLRKSDIVASALDRYLAVKEFGAIRQELIPEAQKRGLYTDEDVFKAIS